VTEKEKQFLELTRNFHWKYDLEEFPDSIFAFKNDELLFEIDGYRLNHKKIITNYRLGVECCLTEPNGIMCNIFVNDYLFYLFLYDNDDDITCLENLFKKHFKINTFFLRFLNTKFVSNFEKHFKSK
jgi:hypothetical protein